MSREQKQQPAMENIEGPVVFQVRFLERRGTLSWLRMDRILGNRLTIIGKENDLHL